VFLSPPWFQAMLSFFLICLS